MMSYHLKTKSQNYKNDLEPYNNPPNVNSLRKIFESNFSFSSIANPFKSKNQKNPETSNCKENERNIANISSIENGSNIQSSRVTPIQIQHGHTSMGIQNCKIKNCCCKTFFQQQYQSKYLQNKNKSHLIPLSVTTSSSVLNPGSKAYATLVKIPQPHRIRSQPSATAPTQNQNKVYEINYDFYKPKATPTFMSPVSLSNKLSDEKTESVSKADRQRIFQIRKDLSLFTNKSKINDGYSKFNCSSDLEEDDPELETKLVYYEETQTQSSKTCNFDFKYRVPRMTSLRENYHPYWFKNSRPSVKKQQPGEPVLRRSRSVNGYDNFAYSRSLGESHLQIKILKDTAATVDGSRPIEPEVVFKMRPRAKVSESLEQHVSSIKNQQCHFESRMRGYNSEVTSLHFEKCDETEKLMNTVSDLKHSHSCDELSCKSETDGICFTKRKSNLKRHYSLDYLEQDASQYRFTRNRRSLDNLSKITCSYGNRNKPDKETEQKFLNIDIHAHALFAAVEYGFVERTKNILDSWDVDVNSLNTDGLSSLDVAVLCNNIPLAKLLISHGAREGCKFTSTDEMRDHLQQMLQEAECRVQELDTTFRVTLDSNVSTVSPIPESSENSKSNVVSIWERRAKGLRKMLIGFEQIKPPDPPSTVTIEVTSVTSIMISFTDGDNEDSSIITKYNVQWSLNKNFCPIIGSHEMVDTKKKKFNINNCQKGETYFVRVASGNIKGYSSYKASSPAFVVLSSWRDITKRETRFSEDVKESIVAIFNQVAQTHGYLKSKDEMYSNECGEPTGHRRKKTAFKQFFTSSSRFQKHLRRGVYLSSLLYYEDKVLVTNEDFLPVLEIDENYPKNITNDFYWLLKIAFIWSDVKWLRNEIEKFENNSSDFRIRLLQAITQMQSKLGLEDLGKVYHKTIRDSEGTIVIPLVNCVASMKNIYLLNLKWIPLSKLIKRTHFVKSEQLNLSEVLLSSVQDQITYHQVSNMKLPRGLYLGYLKMTSLHDSLQIFVPCRAPNIPPHYKIRDNPHVTAEEWEWLVKKEDLRENLSNTTPYQRLFLEEFVVAARKLFKLMEVTEDEAANHRMYHAEVIEISENVSCIMIVQPFSDTLSMFNTSDSLLQRTDLLSLAVQVFDTTHFGVYQPDLISKHSRLSSILEIDTCIAQHNLRQAFSSAEVVEAKQQLMKLENLQTRLNSAWRKGRWLLDVTSFSRDRLEMNILAGLLSLFPERKRTLPFRQRRLENQTSANRFHCMGRSRSEHLFTADYESLNSNIGVPYRKCNANYGHSEICSQPVQYRTSRNGTFGNLCSAALNENEYSEVLESVPSSAKIQVYAAYKTGLETTHRLKFHIGQMTTASEIVELFMKQTNVSTLLKGNDGPIYSEEQIGNFCLVAVVGSRQRCLRDDFKPIYLQSPWKDGQLYVRRKNDVLGNVEYHFRQPTYV